jgi:DNA-binding MarR family transcriptional regulator
MDYRQDRLLGVTEQLIALAPTLRLSQLKLLLLLEKHQPITQTELSTLMGLTPAAISRAVDVLGTSGRRDGAGPVLGLLHGLLDPNDDRVKLLSLTAKGKRLMGVITLHLR